MLQVYRERCELCGKYFNSERGLKSHLVKHTNMALYCKLCSKDRHFTSQISFKKHLSWHSKGELLYTCDFVNKDTEETCSKTFEWPAWLESHKLSHYPPTKACRVHPGCEAIYTYNTERLKHERTGVARKIYKCDDCNVTFKDDINKHIHMGRYHVATSKHYINPDRIQGATVSSSTKRKRQISSSKPEYKHGNCKLVKKAKTKEAATATSVTSTTTTAPKTTRNLSVGDPNLAIPLIPDISSSDAAMQSTSSEYQPSTSMETDDTLPDIC